MYPNLPYSLKAFSVFESVARHLSFTAASEELHVTQGAVSRQIKQLEAFLGFELIYRRHRSIELSERGGELYQVLNTQYSRLDQLIGEWKNQQTKRIVIKASLSFATRILIPKIHHLNEKFPQHEFVVVPTLEDNKIASINDCDVVISCLRQAPLGENVFYLRDEFMAPVCSARSLNKSTTLEQVLTQPRIHATQDHFDWNHWFKLADYHDQGANRNSTFFTLELALSACLAGQGVTVTDLMLILTELKQGYLIAPKGVKLVHSDWRYYCHIKEKSPVMLELIEWLKLEAEQSISELNQLVALNDWQLVEQES
ncbi:LysR family transcriptional regulator [Vibrio sp. FNV 38]|nr:LysR family transcriptional regulator [Vibrio sp. FNV 38]